MEAKATDGGGRFTVVATLIAAAIGGIFGLTGSAIGYIQAEHSLEYSAKQHLQDVRREAYGNLLDTWSDVRQDYLAFSRRVGNGGHLTPSDADRVRTAYSSLNGDQNRVYLIAPEDVESSVRAVDRVFLKWSEQLAAPPKGNSTSDMAVSLNREVIDRIREFRREARQGLTQ